MIHVGWLAGVVGGVGVLILLPVGSVRGQATYYVRPDGGAPTQCTGLVDAPYPGEGDDQPCAWDHPFRALPPGGTTRMSGGDTLIIAQGSYPMGVGAPGSELCDPELAPDCRMPPIPGSSDPNNPTRILGQGWDQGCPDPPELWGLEGTKSVLDLSGASGVEVACLELTDHEGCVRSHPKPALRCEDSIPPYGNWAEAGIYAQDAENVTLRNLNIHGFAHAGVHAGRLRDWTLEGVRIAGNGWVGWDGDIGENHANSGAMTFRRCTVEWNGCGETWPGGNPSGCWASRTETHGDGLSPGETLGAWVMENSMFLHNVSDGLDLSRLQPGASVEIRRSKAEGNAGSQIRVSRAALFENAIVVGNCAFFDGQPFSYEVENCAEQGTAVALELDDGEVATIVNSTVTGEGDCLVTVACTPTANGSERVVLRNNVFRGQERFVARQEDTCLTAVNFCPEDPLDIDYSVIEGVKDGSCPGANDICNVSAGLVDARIDRFDAHLRTDSPAIDSGLPVGGVIPAEDFDGAPRPLGFGVDRGAYETKFIMPHAQQTCRKHLRRRLLSFFTVSLGAMQACTNRVNSGTVLPPCPDSAAGAAIAGAAAKLDPVMLARKCPEHVLTTMTLGGACSGAKSQELAACLTTEVNRVVDALLAAEYSLLDGGLNTPEQRACQAMIARQLGDQYAVKRLKVMNRCGNRLDAGELVSCPDSISAQRIDGMRAKVGARIAGKCSDDLVLELQAAGGFGGECADATTVAELLACELLEHDLRTDELRQVIP